MRAGELKESNLIAELNSFELSDEINLTEEMLVKVIRSGEKLPRDSGLSSSQTRLDGGTRISQSEAYPS